MFEIPIKFLESSFTEAVFFKASFSKSSLIHLLLMLSSKTTMPISEIASESTVDSKLLLIVNSPPK